MRFRTLTYTAMLSCLLSAALIFPASTSAQGIVQTQTRTIAYNGKSFTVQWVTVDLTDPYLRVKPVTAEDGIGHDEPFSSMLTRNHAIAGINGTFFDAYEKDDTQRYPNGLLIGSGEIMHSGVNPAFLVQADKTVSLQRIQTEHQISVTHQSKAYTFTAWGVNKYYGDSANDQVVWYTRAFGPTIDFPNSTKVVVLREGKVTAITTQNVDIPEDGQVFLLGNSANYKTHVLPNIHIGDTVKLTSSLHNQDTGASSMLTSVDAAIGAGPTVNGQSVVLPEAPAIIDGHIYMPLRAIIESLGGQIQWYPQLYRVSLRF
ncbi:copper amine oxidase N-terminal domain-containing protein [Paenibacillus alginolyticus]|uniref:stalk domain-containing protein n=1 Tax=Paenibacillus alginolyticus TaxID=59839 RepID=UPI000492C9C5|nr:stalk domain-containing protein [Paenibacillus alginolyticus]MCY9667224.1 copper amine oxidase N-terminal domain-containing protein [Paenibacillus alginolyticus]